MELFDYDWGTDNSPVDNTEICQMILFYSKEETVEFKKLSKELMKHYWPKDYIENGNIYDLLLKLLREKYESIKSEKMVNGHTSGIISQGNIFE